MNNESMQIGRLIQGLRATKIEGNISQVAVDLNDLAEMVARISQLGHDFADLINQIDVNPIIALENGAIAVDALFVCEPM